MDFKLGDYVSLKDNFIRLIGHIESFETHNTEQIAIVNLGYVITHFQEYLTTRRIT